jgi:hypothetical protein
MRPAGFEPATNGLEGHDDRDAHRRRLPREVAFLHGLSLIRAGNAAFLHGADSGRRTGGSFRTKTEALDNYRDVIEPKLRGVEPTRELTLAEFVDLYLERHAAGTRTRTIGTLRQRLGYATRDFGDVPLRDLERMVDEISSWTTRLRARSRYGIVSALRQTLTTIQDDLTGRYRATDSGPGGVRWCSGSSRFYESISGARTAWPA